MTTIAKPVFVLNGPNLNLLGLREPHLYGRETYAGLVERCHSKAKALGFKAEVRQSNHEGELVTWVQEARLAACGIILNAGAYTHTSIALHDALRAAAVPVIEVHISNIYQREAFRQTSYISGVAQGVLCGFGAFGYDMALEGLFNILTAAKDS